MNSLRILFYSKREMVRGRNIPFLLINNNFNITGRRNINMGMRKLNHNNPNKEINYTENQPKAIRIPIMRYFYGIIILMTVIPITQTLYETNKYYEENKHLYQKEQS
ncbi:hypothetical protein, conserved [Plasmodium gonderi]|uniref:Uncharacterized protein n=1 Tax=Plasmodium gonderi TaxID=77519 RepID=A0A1Y1JHD6_PLAGO|nr:hypothetical protein, conserved [Plasmodium gonderi]GAW81936.1 hypothetical protein, conserved [Plasmodium gonderi]